MQNILDLRWFCFAATSISLLWAVENHVRRWHLFQDYRVKVYHHIKSVIHNVPQTETDLEKIISHFAMYIYYNEFLNGVEVFQGTRPFLIGFWKYIFFPLFIVILFLLAVSILVRPDFLVLYCSWFKFSLAFIHIVTVFYWGIFNRFQLMQTTDPISPENGFKNIERLI